MHTRNKIGFYCPGVNNAGPWRYLHSLLAGIDVAEFEVTVLGDQEGEYAPRPEIRLASLAMPAHLASAVGPGEATTATRGTRAGSRLARLVPRPARQCLGFYRDAARMAKRLGEYRFDLFHTQRTGCEESPLAARQAGIPRVVGTFHVDSTCDLDGVRSGLPHRALEWYSNRCLHRAIAVSEATKRDWMRRTGISDHRVVTIHNGIDPERFCRSSSRAAARGRLGLPADALLIGGMGRLDPVKGFDALIKSLALLRGEFPQAKVAIAGSGFHREQLEAKADALGLAPHVFFLGQLADVNLFLDALDIFAIPSLAETLGYALLEAMAHALPAVGSTVGGIPEVIVPEQTGFLAPPQSPAALAVALRPLLESAELRQQLGNAGRERVVTHFHEADMVRKTLDVYRQMLGTKERRFQ
ncbi:MAG: glycosyltransferase family 4 protein [Pirellulaceae bacterium]